MPTPHHIEHSDRDNPASSYQYFVKHDDLDGTGLHHHHGDGDDILVHNHGGTYASGDASKHRHSLDYKRDYKYGPPVHDHDEPADDHRTVTDDDGNTHTLHRASLNDIRSGDSWADDIDNVTGGNPYNH